MAGPRYPPGSTTTAVTSCLATRELALAQHAEPNGEPELLRTRSPPDRCSNALSALDLLPLSQPSQQWPGLARVPLYPRRFLVCLPEGNNLVQVYDSTGVRKVSTTFNSFYTRRSTSLVVSFGACGKGCDEGLSDQGTDSRPLAAQAQVRPECVWDLFDPLLDDS